MPGFCGRMTAILQMLIKLKSGKCRRCAARLEAEALAALADEGAVLRQRTAVERGVHQAPPTSTTNFYQSSGLKKTSNWTCCPQM